MKYLELIQFLTNYAYKIELEVKELKQNKHLYIENGYNLQYNKLLSKLDVLTDIELFINKNES